MPIDSATKVAVFDFCETLADFQTANAFVDYVRQQAGRFSIRCRHILFLALSKGQVIKLLNTITKNRYSIGKILRLRELKGISRETIDRMALHYYTECVKPHLIATMVDKLRQLQNKGYAVGLSSGGYDVYLKYFVEDYAIDFCQCSELEFKNGRCTGRIVGTDCMREEKVKRLSATFGSTPRESLAFSDSISDLPLLKWAASGVVVSRSKHQDWADKYQLQEIIWQNNERL